MRLEEDSQMKMKGNSSWIELSIFLIIVVAILVFPWIIYQQKYNFFTSIIYVLGEFLVLFFLILGFNLFNKIEYFKERNLSSKLKVNGSVIFFILILYSIITQIFSQFLFFALQGFASLTDLTFYPEKTIFIVPAFAGFFIFITRLLNLYSPLNKKYFKEKIVKDFKGFNILNYLNDYLKNIKEILGGIIIGTILLGFIAIFIYGSIDMPFNYSSSFLLYGLLYGILFAFIDILLGIRFAKIKIPGIFSQSTTDENINIKESNSFFDNHKIIKRVAEIMIILVFIGAILFLFVRYYELHNSPIVNETIFDYDYKIILSKVANYNLNENFSDDSLKLFKDNSSILQIPLVSINNYTYPLSSHIWDFKRELNADSMNISLVERIVGETANFTLQYKNTSSNYRARNNLEEGSNYYYATDYDASIYLTLYEQGYTNISAFCRDESYLSAVKLIKIICAERQDTTTIIEIIRGDVDVPLDSFTVLTKDNETFNIIKKRILETEEGITLIMINNESTCNQMYSLKLG